MESLSEVQQTGTCNMLLLIEQRMLIACTVFVTCAIYRRMPLS